MDYRHPSWLWLEGWGEPRTNGATFPAHISRLLLQFLRQGYGRWDPHVRFDTDDETGLYHRVRPILTGFESRENQLGSPGLSPTTAKEMGSPANQLREQEFLDGTSCATAAIEASTAPRVFTVL